MIRVVFHGELETLAGKREVSFQGDGLTLEALLSGLGEDYAVLKGLVENNGRTELGDLMIIRNGRLCLLPRDKAAVLAPGDEIHLIPPIAGGGR